MPLFALGIIRYLAANKWTWWIAIGLVAIALYFGWRSHQRGVGAAKVVDQLQRESDAAKQKMEKAGDDYRRRGGAADSLRRRDF